MQITTMSYGRESKLSRIHTAAPVKYNQLFALHAKGTAGSAFTSQPLRGSMSLHPLCKKLHSCLKPCRKEEQNT